MNHPDSIQSWIEHEEQVDRRQATDPPLLIATQEPVHCAVCYSTQAIVMQDRALGTGEACCTVEDEDEPPCECVQVDADCWDARLCLEHGPQSEAVRQQREREAAEIAVYYSGSGTVDW